MLIDRFFVLNFKKPKSKKKLSLKKPKSKKPKCLSLLFLSEYISITDRQKKVFISTTTIPNLHSCTNSCTFYVYLYITHKLQPK